MPLRLPILAQISLSDEMNSRIRIKNKSLIQSTYKILSESNNLTITNRENKKGHGKGGGGRGRAVERVG